MNNRRPRPSWTPDEVLGHIHSTLATIHDSSDQVMKADNPSREDITRIAMEGSVALMDRVDEIPVDTLRAYMTTALTLLGEATDPNNPVNRASREAGGKGIQVVTPEEYRGAVAGEIGDDIQGYMDKQKGGASGAFQLNPDRAQKLADAMKSGDVGDALLNLLKEFTAQDSGSAPTEEIQPWSGEPVEVMSRNNGTDQLPYPEEVVALIQHIIEDHFPGDEVTEEQQLEWNRQLVDHITQLSPSDLANMVMRLLTMFASRWEASRDGLVAMTERGMLG